MSSYNDVIIVSMFGRARNHGKKFSKYSQTSFSGIVHCILKASLSGTSMLLFALAKLVKKKNKSPK